MTTQMYGKDVEAAPCLYTTPGLPTHFVARDSDGAWSIVGTQPGAWAARRPYRGDTSHLRRVDPQAARVIAATIGAAFDAAHMIDDAWIAVEDATDLVWFSTQEVAAAAGIQTQSVSKAIQRGTLAAERDGFDYRIRGDAAVRFIRERRGVGRPPQETRT